MPTPLPATFFERPLAHRGLHDRARRRIENSSAAFAAAIQAGYGIELDVQLAADGRAVVFHDSTLDRLTGEEGPVSSRTAEELDRVALAGSDDTIPTLAATLAQVGGRVPLLIELKDQTGALGPGDGRLEAAVAHDLYRYRGPVALMSFNPSMVARLAQEAPEAPRGLTTDRFDPASWSRVPPERLAELRRIDVAAASAAFVSHDHHDLGAPRIAALRDAGTTILAWTIRSPEEEAVARRIAHAITFEGYLPQRRVAPG